MPTKMMKTVALAALFLTAVFWQFAPPYGLPLRVVIAVCAVMTGTQAVRADRRIWAAAFCSIAIIFNPFVQLIGTVSRPAFFMVLATPVVLGTALMGLRTQPHLSMRPITDRTAGSESL